MTNELIPENDPPSINSYAFSWTWQQLKKLPRKLRLSIIFILSTAFLIGATYSLYQFNNWSKQWELHFQIPVQNFIKIQPRTGKLPSPIIKEAKASELKPEQMTVEEYIRYKFGKQANTVMAIMKAESGGNAYAINKNNDKGGTYDLGCMQLNEKWQLKPRGITREQAFNCKISLDVTYQMYQEQGNFCAWVGYKKLFPKNCN